MLKRRTAALRAGGVAAVLVLASTGSGVGQTPGTAVLDSLIRGGITTFELGASELSGAGAAVLQEAARGRQFVALGENHNTAAIPDLTVALFRMLQRGEGFEYVALEEGPALGQALSRAVRRAPDGAFRLGLQFPSAFHMYTEEELRMMDRIGSISRSRGDAIWGVNQEYGLAHVYARLAELATDDSARRSAQAQLERSLRYEAERYGRDTSYLSTVAQPEDFRVLREAFRPVAGSEAALLIDQAELSWRIYAPYAMQPRAHFTVFHESGRTREDNMKRLFAARYREAQAAGDTLPRVLVKSGHVHLNRGMGAFNEAWTLGNFLSELAIFNGRESLHIYALLNWPDLMESFLAPFVPHVRSGTNTLFDLRPLHAWAARNQIPDLAPELRRMLIGYDFLVILSDMTPGSVEALKTPNFRRWPSGD